MKPVKMARHLLLLITLLLGPALCLHGQEASSPGEIARQLASAANDNAITIEDRQESLQKLEEAARLFLSVSETVEAARVLNRVGRLQLILHKPQDASASYSKALELLKQTPVTEVEVDSLNGLGAAYLVQEKKKEEAEKALHRASILSEQSGYTPGWAQALLTLSEAQNTYDHPLALQTAQKALTLWQTLGDKRGLASAYAHLGQYYMAQSMLPESTQNYQQALDLWREVNNPLEQAQVLINLGYIEHRKGAWSNAISFYTQAQGLFDERVEPEMMGEIASGLGAAFNENGMAESGLIQFQRALDYYQQAQNFGYAAYTIRELGATQYLLGNYNEAITHFQQAIALVHNDTLEAECDEYLGRVYLATREYELALQYLQSALPIYTSAFNPKEVARVQALLGQIAAQRGQPENARQNYQLALKTFTRLSDRVNQGAVSYALGQLELQNGNYETAENYLRQSIEVTEDMRNMSRSSDLTAAFSATVYERYETYIECLMHQHEAHPAQGFAVRAFETSELARARSLTELLRGTQTKMVSGYDPQLAEQEQSLRQLIWVKEDYKVMLLSGRSYKTEEMAGLESELTRLKEEYKQVTETIETRYPSYKQITRPRAWSLQQLQEQVIADDQTLLLEYSLGADKSYVWAVTRDGVRNYDLPAQALIKEAAKKVHNLIITPPSMDEADELTPAVQELSRMILWPVARELNKRRVIVVADEELNYIPFQILPTPSTNNEPLVAGYEVINAPSASILGELRQEAAQRHPAVKVLAAFGNPVFASNYAIRKDTHESEPSDVTQALETDRLQYALRDVELNGKSFDPYVIKPLFYAKRELTSLRDVTGEERAFLAGDFSATREQLLSTDLTQYAILHFATHGFLDAERPENSGLLLSTVNREGKPQNGFVGLRDIYQLHAPVDLVVLSACQTALGKDVRGEGLVGLTRGFMYAGASSVVASLWKVEDKATSELMRQFYSNMLQNGMTPAAALRAAQNSIRQKPQWRSPYYWAAFTLQGDYRQVIKTTPASATPFYLKTIACVALLMLGAGLVWLYRRRRLKTAPQSR